MKSINQRSNRVIIGGLGFLVVLAIIVFFGMNRFMDSKTETDVRTIGLTYVKDFQQEELYHYTSIASIRFSQESYIANELMQADSLTADSAHEIINEFAGFQSLSSCCLISSNGTIEKVYGNDIESVDDLSVLVSNLSTGYNFVTSGNDTDSQIIIWAYPAKVPMKNNETSVGILSCRPISKFIEMLHLSSDGTMAYFHIIRKDGSYVTKNDDAHGEVFYEKILDYATPYGMTAEECAEGLKNAISKGETYEYSTSYYLEDSGDSENRCVYASPMPNSGWYLIAICPYNVLDSIIEEMGKSRANAMYICLFIITIGLAAVFIQYYRISRSQIKMLEEAKNMADEALIEAEAATEEATRSRENAENALIEAETANEEAIKAREDAENALVEAETANEEAIKAREDAEEAREEALKANKAKSEFLSNMSHDIRTPMNAIIGMTNIATSHIDDIDNVKECLRNITLASKQMLGLINDILDMSKIESGKLTITPDTISINESVTTISNIIKPQTIEKGQKFEITTRNIISDGIFCDGIRLNQVLLNLLSNAVKFTPEGGDGEINLTWSQEESPKGDDHVRNIISVTDNGIGMTDEFQKKIFEPFEREDSKRVNKIQGTGLGMSITKYIIDAMEGSIDVKSKLGEGTSFTVTFDLPKAESANGGADAEGEADDTSGLDNINLTGKKILLAEDQRLNAIVASTYLKELGAEVDIAEDGKMALDMFEASGQDEYSIILMDLRMPNMNGIESTIEIRKLDRPDATTIPIVAMTADAYSEDVEKCMNAGMNAHISKPIDLVLLKKTLKRFLHL